MVNYDFTTPALPKPADPNTNTVEIPTLAEVAKDGKVLPIYAGPSDKAAKILLAIPGYPYDKSFPSTPPILPPDKVGKRNRGKFPLPIADTFWNDGNNIFQPAYGLGAAKLKPVPIQDQYHYVLQPYEELNALGPDLDSVLSRRLHIPFKKKSNHKNKTVEGRRSLDSSNMVYIVGPDEEHGWVVGAYGPGGPANPVAESGVGGYKSVEKHNEQGLSNIKTGIFGGLMPSFTGQNIKGQPKAIDVFADGIVSKRHRKFPEGKPGEWQPWNNILGPPMDEAYDDKDADFVKDQFLSNYPDTNVNFIPSEEEGAKYQANCVYVTLQVTHGLLFLIIVIACVVIVAVMIHRYREKKFLANHLREQKAEEEERKKEEKTAQDEIDKKRARAAQKEAFLARKAAREAEEAKGSATVEKPKEGAEPKSTKEKKVSLKPEMETGPEASEEKVEKEKKD